MASWNRGWWWGVLLGLNSCTGPAVKRAAIHNRHAGEVVLLGHAGSGFVTPLLPFNPLPSNSWAGIEQALSRGADGVEVDVQLSADSVPMLYHDIELGSLSARAGRIGNWPADSLVRTAYRVGAFYDLFQHERLLRLDTLLRRLQRRPSFPQLHLDLHEGDALAGRAAQRHSARLLRALQRTLSAAAVPLAQVQLTSMRPATLRHATRLLPALPRALEVTDADTLAKTLAAPDRGSYQALVLNSALGTPENVRRIHAANFEVVLFGGRSASTIRQEVEAGPDAIETDNVPVLRQLLGRP